MISDTSPQVMPRGIQLLRAAGLRLAAGGASFYFTHPQRVVAELPPDLAVISQDVYRAAADGARLHAIWLPGRNSQDGRPHDRTIVHSHGFNSSGGVVLARSAFYQRGVLRLASTEDAAPLLAWPLVRSAHARGYNFLLVDTRAHGRSAGRWDTTGVKAMSRPDGLGDVAAQCARPVVGRACGVTRSAPRSGWGWPRGRSGVGSRPWCSTAPPWCPMDSMPVCCTSRFTTRFSPCCGSLPIPS